MRLGILLLGSLQDGRYIVRSIITIIITIIITVITIMMNIIRGKATAYP